MGKVPKGEWILTVLFYLLFAVFTSGLVKSTSHAESARAAGSQNQPQKARTQSGKEARLRVIRSGTLIMDPSAEAIPKGIVAILGNKIDFAGKEEDYKVPEGAEMIDLSDLTVMPGLIDAHTHPDSGPAWTNSPASGPLDALLAVGGLRRAIRAGVTTLRMLGSPDFIDVALRDAINRGVIVGPRVVPAGYALSIAGGHGDLFSLPFDVEVRNFYDPLHGIVGSPADAERAVQLQIKYGAEVIKVAASGGVGSPLDYPSQEQLSQEELNVVADTAHRMGRKCAAHAENVKSVKEALRAGFDTIEHGSELDDEAIRLLLKEGACLVPTLFVVENIIEHGKERGVSDNSLQKAKKLSLSHFPSFQKALKKGVTIAAGSDTHYGSDGGTLIDELKAEVKFGMTPRQAIVSTTVNGARCLGLEDEIGTLAKGKEADLIAVDGDPLTDISALEHLRMVMRNGKILVSSLDGLTPELP